nr:hypothetical transcript [Hymenolepis microstoma]
MNDIREARVTKNGVDNFTIRLQREHQFLQSVIDSFIPIELKKNPLEELLKSAIETSGHVNALLTALESERESSGMGKEELESNRKQSASDVCRIIERKFIDSYNKPTEMQNFENSVRSAEDKEAFNNIKIDLLKFISKIKSEYDILNIIFDWSKMMEQEINHMTAAFSESELVNLHHNTSTEPPRNHPQPLTQSIIFASSLQENKTPISTSNNALFASKRETQVGKFTTQMTDNLEELAEMTWNNNNNNKCSNTTLKEGYRKIDPCQRASRKVSVSIATATDGVENPLGGSEDT